jgi:hypothetical protein
LQASQNRAWGALPRVARRLTAIDPILWLIGAVLVLHYFGTRGIFQGKASGDGYVAFLYFPGLLRHHTFDLAATAPPYMVAAFGREVSGLVANPNPIGPPILWTPFYLLGLGAKRLIITATEAFHGHPPALLGAMHAYVAVPEGEFDYFVTGLGSLFFALIGIWRLFALLRRRLSLPAARFAVATAVLASPLWWYATTQPLYQHACAFFAVTVFVERWDAYRSQNPDGYSPRQAAILGALGGLCLLMRTQQGLWLLLPAYDLLRGLVRALRDPGRSRPDRLRAALRVVAVGALFGLALAIVFAPQALLWLHYYGKIRPPQKPGHVRWGDPALLEMLFSMRAGLFPWLPILYLVIPGLLWLLWRRTVGLALPLFLILVFLGQLWVNAAVYDFHASWGFGPRRFTECVVVLALGLAGLWQALSRRGRIALALCAVLAVSWNGLLLELMRQRRIKSSSSGAFPASVWVRWAKGPEWLGHVFDRVGFPFVQPANLLFSLWHGVPIRAFEGIVGNYPLERDILHRSLVTSRSIQLAGGDYTFVVSGVQPVPNPVSGNSSVRASEPNVRLLIPLRAREPLRLHLVADLGPGAPAVGMRWNGSALPVKPEAGGLVAEVPESLTHSHGWVNELVLTNVPHYGVLFRLDMDSLGTWWQ